MDFMSHNVRVENVLETNLLEIKKTTKLLIYHLALYCLYLFFVHVDSNFNYKIIHFSTFFGKKRFRSILFCQSSFSKLNNC